MREEWTVRSVIVVSIVAGELSARTSGFAETFSIQELCVELNSKRVGAVIVNEESRIA